MDITAINDQQAGAVTLETDVCIAGDGPAGMIMGLFLAKQGMDVIVLERSTDFHQSIQQKQNESSFSQLLYELQLLDNVDRHIKPAMKELLLFLEGEKVHQLLMKPLYKQDGQMNRMVLLALYRQAEQFPHLKLIKGASVKAVLYDEEHIAGIFAETTRQERYFIHSKMTIGTDGEPQEQIDPASLPYAAPWMTEGAGEAVSEAI